MFTSHRANPFLIGMFLVSFAIYSGKPTVFRGLSWYGSAQAAPADATTGPSLWVTPLELNFGPVEIGQGAGPLQVIIRNNGNGALDSFTAGEVQSPFSGSDTCDGGIAPGSSCQLIFSFQPQTIGLFRDTSHSSTIAGPIDVVLRGEGIPDGSTGASVQVTPLVLDFGPVVVGQSSPTQDVIITNVGDVPLTDFSGGGVGLPFAASSTCLMAGINPNESCKFTYSFRPSQTGKFTARPNIFINGVGAFSILLIGGIEMPDFSQNFFPAKIQPGALSTLTYTLRNPNPSATLFEVAFENTLPPGMKVAEPAVFSASPDCGTPIFSPAAGGGSISFSQGTILGGKTCTLQVGVTGTRAGLFTNTTGPISVREGPGASAQARIQVGTLLFLPSVQTRP